MKKDKNSVCQPLQKLTLKKQVRKINVELCFEVNVKDPTSLQNKLIHPNHALSRI